jgi:hypothetical protein
MHIKTNLKHYCEKLLLHLPLAQEYDKKNLIWLFVAIGLYSLRGLAIFIVVNLFWIHWKSSETHGELNSIS